jgi:hypothetical protein
MKPFNISPFKSQDRRWDYLVGAYNELNFTFLFGAFISFFGLSLLVISLDLEDMALIVVSIGCLLMVVSSIKQIINLQEQERIILFKRRIIKKVLGEKIW